MTFIGNVVYSAVSDSHSIQIDLVTGNQTIDLSRSATYLGEDLTIGVSARIDSGLLSAYQFDLVYDANQFSIMSVTDADFFGRLSTPSVGIRYNNASGRLTVLDSLLGGETGIGRTTAGAELLVTITIRVLTDGNKTLVLENAQFTDNSGSVPGIPVSVINNLHSETVAVVSGPNVQNNLDLFTVFPNPYKPNDGDPNTGKSYDGSVGSGIIFLNLPSEVRLKIFTVSGKLVLEETIYNQAQWTWNVRNDRQEALASGVYLYSITSLTTGQTKTGKIMIVQ